MRNDLRAVVSGNIGAYQQGQVLLSPKQIADYYRIVLQEGNDVNVTPAEISDEKIIEIFASVSNGIDTSIVDAEDSEIERITAMEEYLASRSSEESNTAA